MAVAYSYTGVTDAKTCTIMEIANNVLMIFIFLFMLLLFKLDTYVFI